MWGPNWTHLNLIEMDSIAFQNLQNILRVLMQEIRSYIFHINISFILKYFPM